MNITIRLTKVEHEMLKALQKKDKRYRETVSMVRDMLRSDYKSMT